MDLKQYTADATRTESRVDSIQANASLVTTLLSMQVAVGNMLDLVKKNAFYGKAIDPTAWSQHLESLSQDVNFMYEEFDGGVPTTVDTLHVDPRVFHGVIGLVTECTELVEAIINPINSETEQLDTVNMMEELGDIGWYQAILVDATGSDWDALLNTNIAKLKARYPDKFSSTAAINRDLVAERQILESGATD